MTRVIEKNMMEKADRGAWVQGKTVRDRQTERVTATERREKCSTDAGKKEGI